MRTRVRFLRSTKLLKREASPKVLRHSPRTIDLFGYELAVYRHIISRFDFLPHKIMIERNRAEMTIPVSYGNLAIGKDLNHLHHRNVPVPPSHISPPRMKKEPYKNNIPPFHILRSYQQSAFSKEILFISPYSLPPAGGLVH